MPSLSNPPTEERASNREVEHETMRPAREDEAPCPATEPPGSADSVRSPKTRTDPGSSES
ncbi:hypothetical protein [Caulobacter vibrioides]|uniref:Uncharacterized protein n=1 Tax=Caulobacter vibrioides (strain NA1000 / CB15N) TaxID=565050 RepID=A0A0H3CBA2_CAUVN|nr:hypothetical protein [Caulobacter vibrioides]YP_002518684.2 hypothetical protein CCNA_03312 [Caulobacter vibrioides NA1000]ACL96776.2 hypothetical protein CCNA_03312 [Caulobacter vibrioides NA1000]ATC30033.1 hypothetical protein CA607_17250 [Caulobacter vibrioides]QXZ51555.1 hypothetical protein KZH45_16995 [Caulobacter vibrioides]